MNKILSLGVTLLTIIFLVGGFFLNTPKSQVEFRIPVAEADTSETAATSVEVGNAAPVIDNLSLNGGSNIVLSENTVKEVVLTGDLSDANGCGDITGDIYGLIYLDGLSIPCSADSNSCYYDGGGTATDATVVCNTNTCSTGSAGVTCTADMWFHANATNWSASILVTDAASNTDEATLGTPVAVDTLQTLLVTSIIDYGTLGVGDTNTQPAAVTASGNVAVDCSLSGTDMTSDSSGGTIEARWQKYDLSDEVYSTLANTLQEAASKDSVELVISKPTEHPSTEIDITYWGLKIPEATPSDNDYGGTNTFESAPD